MKNFKIKPIILSLILTFTLTFGTFISTNSVYAKPKIIKAKTSQSVKKVAKKVVMVYITNTGTKYHNAGCRYLSKSCIPTSLSDAKKTYTPCSKCHPPQ